MEQLGDITTYDGMDIEKELIEITEQRYQIQHKIFELQNPEKAAYFKKQDAIMDEHKKRFNELENNMDTMTVDEIEEQQQERVKVILVHL
jgi:hypothetical protein